MSIILLFEANFAGVFFKFVALSQFSFCLTRHGRLSWPKQPDKLCLAGDCLIEFRGHLLSRTADIAQRNRLQRLFAMYYLNKMTPTQFKIQLPFGFDSLAIKPGSTSVSLRGHGARALVVVRLHLAILFSQAVTKK